jgi:type II secretion system protein H
MRSPCADRSPTFAAHFRADAGFTLVEIMVLVVIIGLILAASIPNLQEANRTQALRESTDRYETALRRARAIAVTQRTPVRVSIDPQTGNLRVEQDQDRNGSFESELSSVNALEHHVTMGAMTLGGGGGGAATVIFDERGAPDNPGTLRLETQDGLHRVLMVSAGSGHVTVFRDPQTP